MFLYWEPLSWLSNVSSCQNFAYVLLYNFHYHCSQKIFLVLVLWATLEKKIFLLKSSLVARFFFLKRLTKPKPEIFFDYNGNESCKGGPKQNFGKSWHYWVNSVALSKEKKKGCFYTILGTCQKTFVNGCMYWMFLQLEHQIVTCVFCAITLSCFQHFNINLSWHKTYLVAY